jgi:hypothetical protein
MGTLEFLTFPQLTATSENTKSIADSLSVNVMSAVSPAFNSDFLAVMAMVGGVVSVAMESSLLLCQAPPQGRRMPHWNPFHRIP